MFIRLIFAMDSKLKYDMGSGAVGGTLSALFKKKDSTDAFIVWLENFSDWEYQNIVMYA